MNKILCMVALMGAAEGVNATQNDALIHPKRHVSDLTFGPNRSGVPLHIINAIAQDKEYIAKSKKEFDPEMNGVMEKNGGLENLEFYKEAMGQTLLAGQKSRKFSGRRKLPSPEKNGTEAERGKNLIVHPKYSVMAQHSETNVSDCFTADHYHRVMNQFCPQQNIKRSVLNTTSIKNEPKTEPENGLRPPCPTEESSVDKGLLGGQVTWIVEDNSKYLIQLKKDEEKKRRQQKYHQKLAKSRNEKHKILGKIGDPVKKNESSRRDDPNYLEKRHQGIQGTNKKSTIIDDKVAFQN